MSIFDARTLSLIGAVLLLLFSASVVVRVLKRRPESGIDAAILETFHLRVRAWWILFATLAAAFLLGHVATVVLFGLISFWALREFITVTPTRPGDHYTLFWVSCVFTPLQFVLVGMGYYGLYSIVIPVYAFLFIPARIALAGDYKRFLERAAKIQSGLLICVYCLSHAPALLMLKLPPLANGEADTGGGVRLLFFFVLIVQLSDALQYAWSQIPRRHVIVPTHQPHADVGGAAGGHGQRNADRRGAVVGHALPRQQLVDGGAHVGGDLADGFRRRHHHVGHQTRPRREGLWHAGRGPRRRVGSHRLDLFRRPRVLPLHALVAGAGRGHVARQLRRCGSL